MHKLLLYCSPLLCFVFSVGCQRTPPEPPRFHVWGKITFQGQPIPAGSIQFEPKEPLANPNLLGGFATIREGQFDTRTAGRGHFGGPVKMVVNGFDGVIQGEFSQGQPLFPAIEHPIDLPAKDTAFDLQLPLSIK